MSEKMTNATATEVRDILEEKIPAILETNEVLMKAMQRLEDVRLMKSPITRGKAQHLRGMTAGFESALAAMISELREFYN
jgi:hypothetical protein